MVNPLACKSCSISPSSKHLFAVLLSILGAVCTTSGSVASDSVSYNFDVKPILSDRCYHCHGPDAENQASEFRLDTEENALADLGGYAGIVPGDLEASEVHLRIRSTDGDQMPPEDAVRQLTEREKDVLDAWILSGAKYESHWSYRRLPRHVDVPEVGGSWAKNRIDHFVLRRMNAAGLSPNEQASKAAWLRRVTFDLTGLPPTVAEVEAFSRDNSPSAYANKVDELLSSVACAERLTAEWLDVARYSDSYGYQRDDPRFVWPWRDWVIEAFQQNMPYDQFITWQLAGDLLPESTRDQVLATTFNRLHSHKKEGGVAVEEFRIENVADRTHTVGSAFMGLTFECARCHDHKYDPITMRDYYGLSSFFANVDERGLISYFTDAVPTPSMPLPSEAQEQGLNHAADAIASAEKNLALTRELAEEDFKGWLAQREPTSHIKGLVAHLQFDAFESPVPHDEIDEYDKKKKTPANLSKKHGLHNSAEPENQAHTTKANLLVDGKYGKAIKLTGDDAVEIPNTGQYSRDRPFSIALWMKPAEIDKRAVIYRHSRGWDDAGSIGYELTKLGGKLSAKLVHFWPGNSLCVETDAQLQADTWVHVAVTYDGSSKASGLRIFIDGVPANQHVVQDSLTRQITKWSGGDRNLAIGSRYRDRGFKDGLVDEFCVFDRTLSKLEVQQVYGGQALEKALATPTSELTPSERNALLEYYALAIHQPSQQARTELRNARRKWNVTMDSIPAITVMREQVEPRPAYILDRGGYDNRGERIEADTPAFLPGFPTDAPRNRLGLAAWLTSSDHPLTARVAVNRYWQMMFGQGFVRTPEDFGVQGDRPTHPEILDWLARDFVDHGWDVRRLLRMMALSATYRQSAIVPRSVRDKDIENRFLARQFANRLTAEMIRDNALAVSGLLSPQVGGPPAKPYDLGLSYKPASPDQGAGLYRRSLYTFWQRTSPAPIMTTLNANMRDVCRLRRDVVSSPLQALVLLNGTQFVESARVFAGKLLETHGEDAPGIVRQAFVSLTSQAPNTEQTKILLDLYREQLQYYRQHPKKAEGLLTVGNATTEEKSSVAELAAATVLVNSIMNLDECVRLE